MIGIVLCGGLSSRLGFDKMNIQKGNKPLFQWWKNMLNPICSNVYISCTLEQKLKYKIKNAILDEELNQGPMSGIITGIKKFPTESLLVVACDLVNLNEDNIKTLSTLRDKNKMATCYLNNENNLPFPLFTVYENKIFSMLLNEYYNGRKSALDVLLKSEINIINNNINLKGINTTADLLEYQNSLNC